MSNCVVMETIKIVLFVLIFVGYVVSKPQSRYSPPVIKNGTEVVVDAKRSLTLLCEGNENLTWTYPNHTIEGTYWSTVTVETSEEKGKYYAKLRLENASYVDVDYFYCHAQNADKNDSQRSAKIYVYVLDPNHLSATPVDDILFITAIQNSDVTLPCRPAAPNVDVKLYDINGEEMNIAFDRRVGFKLKVSLLHSGHYSCIFERGSKTEDVMINLNVGSIPEYVPKPYIEAPNNGITKVGDTYVLNCTVTVEQNVYFTLNWTTPNPSAVESRRMTMTTAAAKDFNGMRHGSSSLTIKDVHFEDKGVYTCIIIDHTHNNNSVSKNITVFDEVESYINLQEESGTYIINKTAGTPSVQWVIKIESFPTAEILCFNNKGDEIPQTKTNAKMSLEYNKNRDKATLKINQLTLNDSGIYTIIANNGKTKKELNFTLIVTDKPAVHIVSPNYHIFGENTSLDCIAAGNPIPTVQWFFKACEDNSCRFEMLPKTMYTSKTIGLQTISTLKINATTTGLIQCVGSNILDTESYTQGFYITDVTEGFDIWGLDKSNQVAARSKMMLHCAVSKYNYTNDIQWHIQKFGQELKPIKYDNKKFKMERTITEYTYRVTLIVDPISKTDTGTYICVAKSQDTGQSVQQQQLVDVRDPMKPKITHSNMNGTTIKMKPGYFKKTLYCNASGIPYPRIIWRKDDKDWVSNNNRIELSANNELVFTNVEEEDAGVYACRASNSEGSAEKTMKLEIIGANNAWGVIYIIIIILLALFFLVLVTVLVVKIKKEKKLRRELRIAGLMNFEKGGPESLNPDLAVDEQAELLPYDKKWEFPRDKLKLGKQLGSGAFGVVMKAEAFGLVEGETITTVAVKMVKRNADYTYIKALASELKIMVHLGKHLNVVNLLGACTKNVTKRELFVIVEYCRFGNLHNYLLRHRDDFVNQIDLKTGQIDTSIGEEFLNRTMSVGSNQSGSRTIAFAGVDYRATPNPSSTTDSTVVCSPTGEDIMILSNNSSVQPEWRSNYRGDYKGNVRPTSTHDLLCWAFQVARGMEYLASRRVLHGDLAARNILLAEDNIVKICDFGLAKSMYKSDNYKKKGDGPLPVKWMAVESIRDRVFSTQSDVWSFGIVLWEFFSLARTPYPGMDADERLYNKLVDGYRMDQPDYSTKDIYQIMLECWHAKPVYRPSFTKLADDLGNMLQDAVRKHYIDLNDPYIMMNNEHLEGHSDYLAMLSPPDYGNLASPGLGPDYVNGKTLPEEQPAEASGYLKMDIFSPRSNDGSIFDFEVSKNKNVNGELASGVELLPMLHANESDSDMSPTSPSKSFANPNYQTNPTVENKEISAPKKDSIVPTSDNYINMPQQKSAMKNNTDSFSNPSYIHMNNKNIIAEDNDKSNYVNSHSRDWEKPIV